MDLARYRSLLKAVRPCWETICDEAELKDVVTEWIDASDDIENGEFQRMIRAWSDIFFDIAWFRMAPLKSQSYTVQSRLEKVKSKVASVKKNACVGSACKGKTVTDYLNKGE